MRPADAGWWDDLGAARPKKAASLAEDAPALLDVPVAVTLRLASGESRAPNGYSFRIWTGVPVEEPGVSLVVRRRSAAFRALASRIPGDRVLVRAIPSRRAAGAPVLQVLSITGDGDPLTPEERAALQRADRYLTSGNRMGAVDAYEKVLAARRLPDAVAADLYRKCGEALTTEQSYARAIVALRRSLRLAPDHGETRQTLALVENADKRRTAAGHAATSRPRTPISPTFGPNVPERPRLAPPAGMPSLETGADKPKKPAAAAAKSDDPPADDAPPPAPPRLAGPRKPEGCRP